MIKVFLTDRDNFYPITDIVKEYIEQETDLPLTDESMMIVGEWFRRDMNKDKVYFAKSNMDFAEQLFKDKD